MSYTACKLWNPWAPKCPSRPHLGLIWEVHSPGPHLGHTWKAHSSGPHLGSTFTWASPRSHLGIIFTWASPGPHLVRAELGEIWVFTLESLTLLTVLGNQSPYSAGPYPFFMPTYYAVTGPVSLKPLPSTLFPGTGGV